jgi:hypothetical protein
MTQMPPTFARFVPEASLSEKLLPPRLATTAKELFDFVQAPEPMIIAQMLAMFSSLVMMRYRVECAPSIHCQTGLAFLTLADPNMRKSTIDALLSAPVNSWQKSQKNNRNVDRYEYNLTKIRWKARIRWLTKKINECNDRDLDDEEFVAELALIKMQEPQEPRQWVPQLTTGSFTGVSLVMSSQGAGFWNASDGGAALNAMTAHYTSQLADYWSGKSPTHVTRSYGIESASKVAFAVSIAVQQKEFAKFFKSKTGTSWVDSGLLGRFLIAAPTPNIGFRPPVDEQGEGIQLDGWNQRIETLLDAIFSGPETEVVTLALSVAAKEQLQNFRSFCEVHSRPGFQFADVRSAAGKAAENAARVAAAYHVSEECSGLVIEVDLMNKAIATVMFFLEEHMRLFSGELQNIRVGLAADSLLKYLRRLELTGVNLVPTSSVSKHGCKDLRDPNIRLAVMNYVFNMGWVCQGMTTPMSKHNLLLTPVGRERADYVKFCPQPVSL